MASINQDDKDRYKAAFDGLIDDLNRSVLLHLTPRRTDCPNCIFNTATKRSSNRYDTTNPNTLGGPLNKFFPKGSVCPVCHGVGKLRTSRNITVIATISKKPDEFEEIARELGRLPNNLIKVRTKIDTLQAIREAKEATIDGQVYRKIMPEITQGLGDIMFVKTFWEQKNVNG